MPNNTKVLPEQAESQAENTVLSKVSDSEKLLTVKEIAAMLGKSEDTIQNRINELGLKPVVESKRIQSGRLPAQYSYQSFTNLEEEEEEARLVRRKQELLAKHVFALNEEERMITMVGQADTLDPDKMIAFGETLIKSGNQRKGVKSLALKPIPSLPAPNISEIPLGAPDCIVRQMRREQAAALKHSLAVLGFVMDYTKCSTEELEYIIVNAQIELESRS